MIVSDVYVKVLTQSGVKTLADPGTDFRQVLSVTVADGVNMLPQGTVLLPLKNPSDHKPYKSFITPGDLCTIEFHSWNGSKGGWYTALHGPVRSLSERTAVVNGRYEAVTQLTVGSMADILEQDQVAIWMFLGGIKGVDYARSTLTLDEMNTRPYEVAFNWLQKAAFDAETYNYASDLRGWLHLDFDGLEANVAAAHKLSLVEGSHLSIIGQFLDSPFHELYATTGTSADFTGTLTSTAGQAGGVKQPGGGTILKWRAAPYPYCDLGGGPNRSAWERLKLHELDERLVPVEGVGSEYTLAPERNFFLVYPGYDVFNEWFAYSRGVAVVNRDSIRRLGYRPLKTSTRLLMNDEVAESDLMTFSEELAWRLAGQWNNASRWENGTVTLPLYPWIRPGERLRARSPWQSSRTYEYHILGRQMTYSPDAGGRMQLSLERGFDVALDPDLFARGLSRLETDFKRYSQTFREHDKPGH